MFIEHIKSNVQSDMTYTPQKPKKLSNNKTKINKTKISFI